MSVLTRRAALARAAGAGAALALPAADARADQGTLTLLASLGGLVTLELSAVESYDLFVASGVATARTRAKLKRCRAIDLAHAHRLKLVMLRLGGQPPPAPNPGDIQGLTQATTEPAALDFAIALHEQTLAAYLAVFRLISRRPLVRTLGAQTASDAEQLVILRQLAGSPPVPSAFASSG